MCIPPFSNNSVPRISCSVKILYPIISIRPDNKIRLAQEVHGEYVVSMTGVSKSNSKICRIARNSE